LRSSVGLSELAYSCMGPTVDAARDCQILGERRLFAATMENVHAGQ